MKTTFKNLVNLSLQTLLISSLFFSCSPDSLIDGDILTTTELQPTVLDTDGDGLIDELEIILGTDVNNPDTDNDGIFDGIEDFNRNGKIDSLESSPLLIDTDKDGILDGLEDRNHNGIFETDETSPIMTDTDKDGIPDGIEDANKNGKYDQGEMKATSDDSDNDGIKDTIEDMNHNGKWDVRETDPNNPDTDGDGILDGVEDANGNGKIDAGEMYPLNKDTDGDLVEDGAEDANHNGKKDADEMDPLKQDTDGDGIKDGDEDKNHNGKKDAHESDAKKKDTDGDGINDKEDADANGDGVADVDEIDDDDDVITADKYEAVVTSSDGYEVKIKIEPKSVDAATSKCENGYNYTVELKYDIKINGKNKPKNLYTLQGTLDSDTEKIFFDLPTKKGKGKVKTSNDWTDQTNCKDAKISDMNFKAIVIEIEGPGIPNQKVTLTKDEKNDKD